MPFAVRRKGNRYQVVNAKTGHVFSTTTRVKAEKQVTLLRSIEKDWQATGQEGVYKRTINGEVRTLHVK